LLDVRRLRRTGDEHAEFLIVDFEPIVRIMHIGYDFCAIQKQDEVFGQKRRSPMDDCRTC